MKNSPQGFSLIELIISLGIVSTSLVGLLGLMAMAFGQLHESGEMTVHTQIVRSLASEVEMLDFSALTHYISGFPRYYDDEGQSLQGTDVGVNYTVALSFEASQLPGLNVASDCAKRLVVTVTNRKKTSKTYCVWAVNNGG